jgi:hypothetical protein
MNLNIKQVEALFKINPQITIIRGDVPYDTNGNEVAYDLSAVEAKIAQDEADKVAQQAAKAAAEQSAISKLSALGLTADEIAALRGQ